jgi:CRISPR/Cas system-associated protein Csm6
MHLTTALARLLVLASDEPDRACAELDLLVAWHGREAMAHALQQVAGTELATLGLT